MSLIGSIDSTKNCLVQNSRTYYRPFLDFLYPTSTRLGRHQREPRRAWHPQPLAPRGEQRKEDTTQARRAPPHQRSSAPMDNLFINALLQAGTCRRHVDSRSGGGLGWVDQLHHKRRRRTPYAVTTESDTRQLRRFSVDTPTRRLHAATSAAMAEPEPLTREEANSLVVQYEDGFSLDPQDYPGIEHVGRPPGAQRIQHHWVRSDVDIRYTRRKLDGRELASIGHLIALLENPESAHKEVFDVYRQLPAPRVSYLTEGEMDRLLQHLARVEKHSEVTRLRYMSVLDDLKAAGIPIKREQWNSAVNMAGKFMETIDGDSVQSALLMWRQMEQEAGVQGSHVTFTVLFDIATKAEKFILAEKILAEMNNRNLRADRIHRHALIWHYGKKSDGIGVRNAYRELVDSGCVVDTYTLNVVIISLLRANEPSAAEHVFGRMKQLHASKTDTEAPRPLPPNTWRTIRDLQRILNKLVRPMHPEDPADAASKHPKHAIPVAPDSRTYKTLIKYYGCHTANFDRVVELLSEMPAYDLQFSPPIFSCLFRAFSEHGGVRYSAWTLERLETVWITMLNILDHSNAESDASESRDGRKKQDFQVNSTLVEQTLRAFARCGHPHRVMEVWDEFNRRWRPNDEEMTKLIVLLRRLVPRHNQPSVDSPSVWRRIRA
jgi:hypothetical protein